MTESKSVTSGFDKDREFGDQVHESKHPVLLHKITVLRSSSTDPAAFRSVLREVTYHLAYEATAKLTTRPVAISVPEGHDNHIDATGHKLVERVAVIPILRSGLGMVEPFLELTPKAEVHHIGTCVLCFLVYNNTLFFTSCIMLQIKRKTQPMNFVANK